MQALWRKQVCRITAFWAVFRRFELLFYILWGPGTHHQTPAAEVDLRWRKSKNRKRRKLAAPPAQEVSFKPKTSLQLRKPSFW